jgi:predicted transcriptional regulator
MAGATSATQAAKKKLRDLTDLQLAILSVFWERGEATANDVHEALADSMGLARGTIGTLLHRLERQRLLAHRADGREYFYRALVSREEVMAARVAGLVGGLFQGDLAAMVSFAVSRSEIDGQDVKRLRALLDRHAGSRTRP